MDSRLTFLWISASSRATLATGPTTVIAATAATAATTNTAATAATAANQAFQTPACHQDGVVIVVVVVVVVVILALTKGYIGNAFSKIRSEIYDIGNKILFLQ